MIESKTVPWIFLRAARSEYSGLGWYTTLARVMPGSNWPYTISEGDCGGSWARRAVPLSKSARVLASTTVRFRRRRLGVITHLKIDVDAPFYLPGVGKLNETCTAICTATGFPSFIAGLNFHCRTASKAFSSNPIPAALITLKLATVPVEFTIALSVTTP